MTFTPNGGRLQARLERLKSHDEIIVSETGVGTPFARSEDRTKALRSEFELHLARPVDPGELVGGDARPPIPRRSVA